MKKIFTFVNIIFFLFFGASNSEVINNINILGNERIANETVILFSEVDKGSDIDEQDLNNILKKLNNTNFFSDVSVELTNNILNIKVTENPIIQSIEFKGIKAKKN